MSVQLGYILKPVDMYQARTGDCGSNMEVHAVSRTVVEKTCSDRVGCLYFKTNNKPAQIWYEEGHREVLQHEIYHCMAGGPIHEGEILVAGQIVAADRQHLFAFND